MKKSLIVHPNFQELGEKIAQDRNMNLVPYDFRNFPDGTPNHFIHRVKELIEHKDVTYIWDFSRQEDLFENYAAMRWILDYYADKLRVIMPYFPVGTMERISKKGEIATAKYFADIMSTLPPGRVWKTSIHTFDIHALQERFYFDAHSVNLEMHTAMNILWDVIKDKTIVFPDDGAEKRFWDMFEENDTVTLGKVREGEKRIVHLKDGNPKDKDVLIVDDLAQTCGTLIESAKLLRAQWAKSVSAFITHWVFPEESYKKLSEVVDNLYVTDSIPANNERAAEVPNMHIVSLQQDIEKLIFADETWFSRLWSNKLFQAFTKRFK